MTERLCKGSSRATFRTWSNVSTDTSPVQPQNETTSRCCLLATCCASQRLHLTILPGGSRLPAPVLVCLAVRHFPSNHRVQEHTIIRVPRVLRFSKARYKMLRGSISSFSVEFTCFKPLFPKRKFDLALLQVDIGHAFPKPCRGQRSRLEQMDGALSPSMFLLAHFSTAALREATDALPTLRHALNAPLPYLSCRLSSSQRFREPWYWALMAKRHTTCVLSSACPLEGRPQSATKEDPKNI